MKELLNINRSLTGEGVHETLHYLQKECDFDIFSVESGTKIFDWEVPKEWSVNEAYIKGVVDFRDNNLHLVGYSRPFKGELTYEELEPHIHTHPDAIPYKTTYYEENWGFCMTEEDKQKMDTSAKYEVVVDTELKDGKLYYGHKKYEGVSDKTYLFSTYSCHPNLANDNFSGMVLWSKLNKWMSEQSLKHNYEFLIAPETIGALVYLDCKKPKLDGAFVLTCVGLDTQFSRKRAFEGDYIDKVVDKAFKDLGHEYTDYPFDVRGSDERQFSSPAFRIPTTSIHRGKYYEYPEYHTSKDDYMSDDAIEKSLEVYKQVVYNLESDTTCASTVKGEAMMGKRGLYSRGDTEILLWTLFYSDGKRSVFDIACTTGYKVEDINKATFLLLKEGLLE